ncbi:MAG: DUF6394 family protein [Ghiorsea sp.]
MNFQKVLFAFFILLALTLNFGFFIGDIDNVAHHNIYELFAAIVVGLIATALKFGERSHVGALLLATSLVADVSLIAAAITWGYASNVSELGVTAGAIASVVSLSGGALLANSTSVILLVIEASTIRR